MSATTGVTTPARVAAVRTSLLLETGPEEAFDRLTRLAAIILATPMVALTIVDDVRSFLKGAPDPGLLCGSDGTYESPVRDAACQVVIDTGDVVCAPDTRADPRLRDLPQIHQFGAASWLGVPVCDPDGFVVGNFCAMDTVVRDWTVVEVGALETLASVAGGEIALRQALRTSQRHAAEVAELADTLQQSLIPSGAPRVPGVEIGVRFRPGGSGVEVMGDFYDVLPLECGFGVVIGDVCGKGVPAARATGMARSAVRTAAHSERDPVAVLHTLNEVMHIWFGARTSFLTAQYATFHRPLTPPVPDTPDFHADIDAEINARWEMRVAGGGHPSAYVCRADGSVERIAGGGRALGLAAECPVSVETALLGPGDSAVFHTDGITEARHPITREQLDEPGVIATLASLPPDSDADTIAGALHDAAFRYAGDRTEDDSGVVVVRIPPR